MKEIKISGKKLAVTSGLTKKFQEVRPGGWHVALVDGERVRFRGILEKGKFWITRPGQSLYGETIEKTRGEQGVMGSDADLVSQFPGKVRKIIVKEGDSVKEGDPLLLVEAMKMEFSIKAPRDGKIKKIYVHEGEQLSPGKKYLDL